MIYSITQKSLSFFMQGLNSKKRRGGNEALKCSQMETLCSCNEAQLGSSNRSVLALGERTYRFLLGIILPRGSRDGFRVTKCCLGIFVGVSLVLWNIGAFLWRHPKYTQICCLCTGRRA